MSPTTSSSSAGYPASPTQGGDGERHAQSTFFALHGASVAIGSEANNGPGAGEAASPILQPSAVAHRSWPSAVPSHGERSKSQGQAQRGIDPGLEGVMPAAAAKLPYQANGNSANGTSLKMARGAPEGGQGRMQSGNDTSERTISVGVEADRAGAEGIADGAWSGDGAREQSDAVSLKPASPLPEGETATTISPLQDEHGHCNCTNAWVACYYAGTTPMIMFHENPGRSSSILFVSQPKPDLKEHYACNLMA